MVQSQHRSMQPTVRQIPEENRSVDRIKLQTNDETRPSSHTSETKRILQVNNKLKSELLMVISQMEVQLNRVKTKRRERIEAELDFASLAGDKSKELRESERKKEKLKRKIEQMWIELENTYNHNTIV